MIDFTVENIQRSLVLALLLLLPAVLPAQSLLLWEDNLEELAELTDPAAWEDELEDLAYLRDDPLDLNTATREQLERFPFLNARQVENIQAYVYLHGPMQSIYELMLVPGMDRLTAELLQPFVCVKPVAKEKDFPSKVDSKEREGLIL